MANSIIANSSVADPDQNCVLLSESDPNNRFYLKINYQTLKLNREVLFLYKFRKIHFLLFNL